MLHTHISANDSGTKSEMICYLSLNERNQVQTLEFLDATNSNCCFICCKALLKNSTSYFASVKSYQPNSEDNILQFGVGLGNYR